MVHGWAQKFAKGCSPGLEHAPTTSLATTMGEMLAKYAVDSKMNDKNERTPLYGAEAVKVKLQALKNKLLAKGGVQELKLAEVKAVSKFMWLLSVADQHTMIDIENKVVAASQGGQLLKEELDTPGGGKKVSKNVGALFEGSTVV